MTGSDPVTVGVAVVIVFIAALGAASVPMRRALAIDPIDTLRAD